jgi:hypothetical protein
VINIALAAAPGVTLATALGGALRGVLEVTLEVTLQGALTGALPGRGVPSTARRVRSADYGSRSGERGVWARSAKCGVQCVEYRRGVPARSTEHRLRTADCGLRSPGRGVQSAEYGQGVLSIYSSHSFIDRCAGQSRKSLIIFVRDDRPRSYDVGLVTILTQFHPENVPQISFNRPARPHPLGQTRSPAIHAHVLIHFDKLHRSLPINMHLLNLADCDNALQQLSPDTPPPTRVSSTLLTAILHPDTLRRIFRLQSMHISSTLRERTQRTGEDLSKRSVCVQRPISQT